jgi:hypothetical protein
MKEVGSAGSRARTFTNPTLPMMLPLVGTRTAAYSVPVSRRNQPDRMWWYTVAVELALVPATKLPTNRGILATREMRSDPSEAEEYK